MKINSGYLRGQASVCGHNNPQYLIIHHPEYNGSIEGLNDVMRNMGFTMIGYNYYVRKDGSVWKGRPDNVTSGNCYNYNTKSLGICFEGNYDKETSMPQAQFNAGVELIKELRDKYGISNSHINGHKYYYNTECPGKYFPLAKMLDAIKGGSATGSINTSNSVSSNIKYDKVYSQTGTCTVITESGLKIRATASLSGEQVGLYKQGESVNYDLVVENDGYRWISWIGASSGKRRYMAVRELKTNKVLGKCG